MNAPLGPFRPAARPGPGPGAAHPPGARVRAPTWRCPTVSPTKLHVLDCGAMSCDLTWLLLKPGRSIRPRGEKDLPAEWVTCTTHAVLVETPEGTLLWDTSCPRDWET